MLYSQSSSADTMESKFELPRIFVIGHHKIATRSIDRLFRDDGYTTMHFKKGKIAKTIFSNLSLFRPLLTGLEHVKVLSDMEYVNGSGEMFFGYRLFPQLDFQYPGSYFIYNYRDIGGWVASQLAHKSKAEGSYSGRYKKNMAKLLGRKRISNSKFEQHLIASWQQHESDVNNYFQGKSNLIRLNIEDSASKAEFINKIRSIGYVISRNDLPHVGKTKTLPGQ